MKYIAFSDLPEGAKRLVLRELEGRIEIESIQVTEITELDILHLMCLPFDKGKPVYRIRASSPISTPSATKSGFDGFEIWIGWFEGKWCCTTDY